MHGAEGDAATHEGQQGAERKEEKVAIIVIRRITLLIRMMERRTPYYLTWLLMRRALGWDSLSPSRCEEQAAEALEQLLETALAPKTDPANPLRRLGRISYYILLYRIGIVGHNMIYYE